MRYLRKIEVRKFPLRVDEWIGLGAGTVAQRGTSVTSQCQISSCGSFTYETLLPVPQALCPDCSWHPPPASIFHRRLPALQVPGYHILDMSPWRSRSSRQVPACVRDRVLLNLPILSSNGSLGVQPYIAAHSLQESNASDEASIYPRSL